MIAVSEPQVIIGNTYIKKVLPLIEKSRYSVDIIIYEWRIRSTQPTHPVSLLVRALQDAAQRGVRVRAFVGSALVVQQLKLYGITARTLHSQKLMHAKMMLIDSCTAVIGSHNYTQSAFTSNLEISLVVQLSETDNELSRYFNNLWSV